MFEHHTEQLLAPALFLWRMLKGLFGLILLAGTSLFVGVLGYHYFESLAWIDALLNASMILGGMGPVATLHTETGKVFASCYALYSGLFMIVSAGMLITPVMHRMIHSFHLPHPPHPKEKTSGEMVENA